MKAHYRRFTAADRLGLLELFGLVRPSIGGMSCPSIYNAIMHDALHSRDATVLVASIDSTLVGYVIAAQDWSRFKPMFVLRHPMVGSMAVAKRVRRNVGNWAASSSRFYCSGVNASPGQLNGNEPRSRGDSTNRTAMIVHIGVDPRMRSRGLGRGLLAGLSRDLDQQGLVRIDAHIDRDNAASQNMFRKAGWTVIQDASGFRAFLELP